MSRSLVKASLQKVQGSILTVQVFNHFVFFLQLIASVFPIRSMYGIFTYIYHGNQPNVVKYAIHGWYGFGADLFFPDFYSKHVSQDSLAKTTPMCLVVFLGGERCFKGNWCCL